MLTTKTQPGQRAFKCDSCGATYAVHSEDCHDQSASQCVTCGDWNFPIQAIPDPGIVAPQVKAPKKPRPRPKFIPKPQWPIPDGMMIVPGGEEGWPLLFSGPREAHENNRRTKRAHFDGLVYEAILEQWGRFHDDVPVMMMTKRGNLYRAREVKPGAPDAPAVSVLMEYVVGDNRTDRRNPDFEPGMLWTVLVPVQQ